MTDTEGIKSKMPSNAAAIGIILLTLVSGRWIWTILPRMSTTTLVSAVPGILQFLILARIKYLRI